MNKVYSPKRENSMEMDKVLERHKKADTQRNKNLTIPVSILKMDQLSKTFSPKKPNNNRTKQNIIPYALMTLQLNSSKHLRKK